MPKLPAGGAADRNVHHLPSPAAGRKAGFEPVDPEADPDWNYRLRYIPSGPAFNAYLAMDQTRPHPVSRPGAL